MANEIEVRLVLDDGTYKKALLKVEGQSEKVGKKVGKNLESSSKVFKKSLLGLKSTILSLGAAYLGVMGGRAILNASKRQQDAVNNLNQALRSAGTFSQEATDSLQAFAAEIERTTIVSDEAALEQLTLARAFSRSNEEAAELTKAAIELSAATGIQVESAVRNLGKSFSGLLGELGELLPATRNLTQEQLKSGEAVRFVIERFGGSAAAQTRTFSGAVESLSNAFGTLLEQLGDTVTNSKVLRVAFSFISKQLSGAADNLKKIDLGSQFDDLIIKILGVGEAINVVFGTPLELAFNATKIAVDGIKLAFQTLIAGAANASAKVISFFAPDSEMAKNAQAFAESTGSVFRQFEEDTVNTVNGFASTPMTEQMDQIIVKMREAAIEARATGESFKQMNNDVAPKEEQVAAVQTGFQAIGEHLSLVSDGMKSQLNSLAENGKKNFQNFGKSAVQGIGNAAGSAFAAFGKALASGENALDAFINSLLASMGQMAIQLGTQFILQGLAYQFAGLPNGGALIGAGAALATFGGVLSALGGGDSSVGGGGGAASGGTPEGGGAGVIAPDLGLVEPDEAGERGPQVQVRIEGNVLDRRETGLEIVSIINEAFETQGATVRTV